MYKLNWIFRFFPLCFLKTRSQKRRQCFCVFSLFAAIFWLYSIISWNYLIQYVGRVAFFKKCRIFVPANSITKIYFYQSSEKHLVLTECAESLGSDPANGTLQSLEIGDVLFAAAHSFLYHYANSTSSSPRYDADRSQDQPSAVPAAQHSDSDPFTSARLTTDCQSNHPCSLSCRVHDKDGHFIVK